MADGGTVGRDSRLPRLLVGEGLVWKGTGLCPDQLPSTGRTDRLAAGRLPGTGSHKGNANENQILKEYVY